jgi:hypothetical protein
LAPDDFFQLALEIHSKIETPDWFNFLETQPQGPVKQQEASSRTLEIQLEQAQQQQQQQKQQSINIPSSNVDDISHDKTSMPVINHEDPSSSSSSSSSLLAANPIQFDALDAVDNVTLPTIAHISLVKLQELYGNPKPCEKVLSLAVLLLLSAPLTPSVSSGRTTTALQPSIAPAMVC